MTNMNRRTAELGLRWWGGSGVVALLLYPAAEQQVVTVVGLRTFPATSGPRLEALGEELCVPEEMLELPRDRSVVETQRAAC